MKKKILIFAPSYNDSGGGVIVLHKLCSILNQIGYESFLHPYFESYVINKSNYIKTLFGFLDNSIRSLVREYATNPIFETPVIYSTKNIDWEEWVVIYPEVTFGNPLGAKNVVRWLLHHPGYHHGDIYFGQGELYFRFNSAISDFSLSGSSTSNQYLKVIHYPLEFYNTQGASSERSGTAYCIRKGKGKPIQHNIEESILIDGKSHEEVSQIFKKVKRFISYDTLTAYSIFAVLSGCESVVIPDKGVNIDQWYPDYRDRYGISYGFSNIEEAAMTKHLVKSRVVEEQERSIIDVQSAFNEIDLYFETS